MLIRPAGNNAVRKYYTLEGILLESVLASILPEGEITYQQFLTEMFERYGLLVGGRPEDVGILLGYGIGSSTVQDLRGNSLDASGKRIAIMGAGLLAFATAR